ncbi:pyrroline-5-carboxylate reductase, partial [Campylobacter jejuni]|nr:pyrroline-5-carboxylate reductase [Campylobacter jejuni]
MLYILANGSMATALAYVLKDYYEICILLISIEKIQALSKEGFITLLYKDF